MEANLYKAKAEEQAKLAKLQALAQVEAQAKHKAIAAQEQAKVQLVAN